jgi:hypothetical protein
MVRQLFIMIGFCLHSLLRVMLIPATEPQVIDSQVSYTFATRLNSTHKYNLDKPIDEVYRIHP